MRVHALIIISGLSLNRLNNGAWRCGGVFHSMSNQPEREKNLVYDYIVYRKIEIGRERVARVCYAAQFIK